MLTRAYVTNPIPVRTAMTTPTALTVLAASTAANKTLIGSVTPAADAVWTLGLLAGGVGPDGRARDDDAGVDAHPAAVHGEREAVEASRGRATLLLPVAVVLRP